MTVAWPMQFPNQRCSYCGELTDISVATAKFVGEILVGWCCAQCKDTQ